MTEPQTEDARLLTPTGVNSLVQQLLQSEPELFHVWVEGEIIDCKHHSSGHIYFSLKDSNSTLRCNYYKSANQKRTVDLKDGKKIRAFGDISVFVKNGSYNLTVLRVAETGLGDVYERLKKTYQKLSSEGLFDESRKKPLPKLPLTLGVATAATGAALRDIIQVARSRFQNINILLAPCIVQGNDALTSVPTAIEVLNLPQFNVDVIIAGRGGGSFDDLMPFNEEPIIRAFANSRVPIIAAVGHQIDHPLCEFAADVVAATPSNAAEIAVPVINEVFYSIDSELQNIENYLNKTISQSNSRLNYIQSSRVFQNSVSILEPFQYRLDQSFSEMKALSSATIDLLRNRIKSFDSLPLFIDRRLTQFKHRLSLAADRLETLSPLATLKRGYSIVTDDKNNIIRSTSQLKVNQSVAVALGDGKFQSTVTEITKLD
ncbi:MAG: exodeoxyribonuclease VII large subunit [Leptonema sp. (in: Bacteria)]|nr:exodeoxyribonuclease VII large subunit [Leptonema sp. (in: bacteria)]